MICPKCSLPVDRLVWSDGTPDNLYECENGHYYTIDSYDNLIPTTGTHSTYDQRFF